MESLKKKFNEIGMQASGFYQSSFCVICNGKYHLSNDSDEEKEPKPHTEPTKFQSLRFLTLEKYSLDGKTPTNTSSNSLLFELFYFFLFFLLSSGYI